MLYHYFSAKSAVNALLLTTVGLQVILLPSHASKPPAKSSITYRHPSENRRAQSATSSNRGTILKGRREACSGSASGNPTFWFLAKNASSLNFAFVDSVTKRQVFTYKSGQDQKIADGLGKIVLPENSLVADHRYRWKLTLECLSQSGKTGKKTELSGDFYRVDGATESSLQRALGQAKNARERLEIYADRGIWYEMLTELLALRQQEPKNTLWIEDWNSLLKSPDVKLEEQDRSVLTQAAFSDCCTK
jgi:Domain of Unknown Function (DUF928)